MFRNALIVLLAVGLFVVPPLQASAYVNAAYHVQKHYISGTRTISGAVYELSDDGTAVFCKPSSKRIEKLKVPARVTWAKRAYVVTAIAPKACASCKQLVYVSVGKNVTDIGASAFEGCAGLLKFVCHTKRVTMKMLKTACVL